MEQVYWSPVSPSAGVIAAGFRAAHRAVVDPEAQEDVARAADAWWEAVDAMPARQRSPEAVLAAAVASGRAYGVELPVARGLAAHVGRVAVGAASDESWEDEAKAWFRDPLGTQDTKQRLQTTTLVLGLGVLAAAAFIAYTKSGR